MNKNNYLLLQEPLPSKRVLAHRAVVINAENEARLPPHLLNPFYKNPRIAAALAKESWSVKVSITLDM